MYAVRKLTALSVGFLIVTGLGIYLIGDYRFYNPTYGENIELRGYLLTDEQIVQAGNFFAENNQFYPKQLSFDQLYKSKKNFIVILAKNTGPKQARGTVDCMIRNASFDVPVLGLNPCMKESAVWFIPLENTIPGYGNEQLEVLLKWSKLYAK